MKIGQSDVDINHHDIKACKSIEDLKKLEIFTDESLYQILWDKINVTAEVFKNVPAYIKETETKSVDGYDKAESKITIIDGVVSAKKDKRISIPLPKAKP